ncbi:hypothetical protein ACP3WF_24050, partial [Salmonella enterica]|uniref:hypothetical protein n=1 Tax=Salmonella enterica TaxID=28901 RepID=UPI003CFB5185
GAITGGEGMDDTDGVQPRRRIQAVRPRVQPGRVRVSRQADKESPQPGHLRAQGDLMPRLTEDILGQTGSAGAASGGR